MAVKHEGRGGVVRSNRDSQGRLGRSWRSIGHSRSSLLLMVLVQLSFVVVMPFDLQNVNFDHRVVDVINNPVLPTYATGIGDVPASS